MNPLYFVAPEFRWQFDTPMVCKGPSALQKQTGQTDYSTAGGLQGQASNINQTLVPTLEGEAQNPQGFGELGLNQIEQQGGQAVAGQLGAGKEAAILQASRSGNPASTASITDALTRAGMNQQSTNALNANVANQKAKLGQQQAGLGGLEHIAGQDQSEALQALGLTNSNQQDIAQEEQAQFSSILNPILGLGGAVAGAAGTALGGK